MLLWIYEKTLQHQENMLWQNYQKRNKRQFFIPRGFAHGFLVLSEEAIFTYKVDNIYAPQSEASLRWNDETVGIEWPIDVKDIVISDKDLNRAVDWKDADLF